MRLAITWIRQLLHCRRDAQVSSSRATGWEEVFRGPLGNFAFDGTYYSYTDTSATPDTWYVYDVQAINSEDGSGQRLNAPAYWVSGGGSPGALHLLDASVGDSGASLPLEPVLVDDSEEESVGYFLPLNNNFDEGNLDIEDNPIPDNEADATVGHRILNVGDDPQLQLVTVTIVGDTRPLSGQNSTVSFQFPENIKLWEFNSLAEIQSDVVYDFDDEIGAIFVPSSADLSGVLFYVEGISASDAARDVELVVTVTPAKQPLQVQEDKIRFTVGDLQAYPPSEISADAGEIFAYVPIIAGHTAFDGQNVTVNLLRNGSVVDVQNATIENGSVTVIFDAPQIAGTEYVLETFFQGSKHRGTDTLHIVPGAPHSIEAVATKTKYTADGTDTTTITVTVRDQFGNLVEDGTPVNWNLGFGMGTFTDGSATAATETTDGQATVTLRAPELSGIQHVSMTAGQAQTTLDIVAETPSFDINGIASLNLAASESGVVSISNANVADGTPIFWTLSNGQIAGGENGGRVIEATIQSGTATINVSAAGPWSYIGPAIVTATVAGQLIYHEIDFYSTAPFSIELDHVVLSGDKTTDGSETLVYENANPTYLGQPLWGFSPPPPQEWPASRDVDYFAETQVTIRGTALQTYYLIADSAFTAFAQFIGLGSSNEIQLNGSGIGTFTIRSRGLLANNELLPIDFTVREGSPLVGAPETTERVLLVDHNWWTRTVDTGQSFIGGDPQTAAGVGANMAGGMLIIGDAGAMVKNGWRQAGYSDVEPNKTEVLLTGAGLATEFFFVVGETADGPISLARALAAAARKADAHEFANALFLIVKRGYSNAQDLAKLGTFLLKISHSDAAFQAAMRIFTSEQLIEAGIRSVDELGDLGGAFVERLAFIAQGFGIKASQDIATLFGKLDGQALDFFKQLNPSQLEEALDHLGTILKAGKVDVAQMQKLLKNDRLYTAAYGHSQLLADLRLLSNTDGVSKLVNFLAGAVPEGPVVDRLYELQSAPRILDDNPAAKITFIQKFTREVDSVTGKTLSTTDIDFIVDDGVNVIYYQAKSSANAFGSSAKKAKTNAIAWVWKAREDARRNGISNQIIRYVTPNPNGVSEAGNRSHPGKK